MKVCFIISCFAMAVFCGSCERELNLGLPDGQSVDKDSSTNMSSDSSSNDTDDSFSTRNGTDSLPQETEIETENDTDSTDS